MPLRDKRMVRLIALLGFVSFHCTLFAEPWQRHTIDDSSRGADGVKTGDFDRDGFADIVTGWEEGGRIRICFQPNDVPNREHLVRSVWESVTVGRVDSPEDAVAFDFNRDGWLDVISCCEGSIKNVFVHLNPGTAGDVRNASKWVTKPLEGAAGVTRWMYAAALDDSTLVFGSKSPAGQISICDVRSGEPKWSIIRNCDWVMSLRVIDIDQDGFRDVVYSDRKGPKRQVGWLKNPGDAGQAWSDHLIGGRQREMMFLDLSSELQSRNSQAGESTIARCVIACHTKGGGILMFEASSDVGRPWDSSEVPSPDGTGSGKAVALGDIDLDGSVDLVCSCEHAGNRVGVYGMTRIGEEWIFKDISGNQLGTKFDRIELMDLDLDGDLDVVTCEERNNLGVIWYENPIR